MNDEVQQERNLGGRPPKQKGASDLRTVRSKLRGLRPESFKVLEAALNDKPLDGKPVSKEQVATAKWVVNTEVVVHKAIIAEESGNLENEDSNEELDVKETKNKLSLVMVK